MTAPVLEEGLPLTPLFPPETDYIKRRSVSNMVNLMKITAVTIVFSEALLDPTFFNNSFKYLYQLEMIQYFSQATKETFISEMLLKLFTS